LLLLALVPRLLGRLPLNNTDELLWVARTINFWTALSQSDWAGTLQSLHPGAVPPWGFGAALSARYGIAQLQAWQATDTLPMLDVARTAALFPILLTSVTVVISYHWLTRLAGRRVAFMAGLMLALEPYYLAHSTFIHLDATVTSFMFLAALAWLVYLLADGGRGFLILAGILTGLAIMTKIQALYLVPYAALGAGVTYLVRVGRIWSARSWREIGRLAAAFGVLLLLAGVTAFVIWPVLWVDGLEVVATVVERATGHLNQPHQLPTYFLGQQSIRDPGPLYYALTLAFRLRPLTLILAPLSILLLLLAWHRLSARQRAALTLGIAYPLFFFIEMSLGSQKMERYLLPMVPALVTLAAAVLVAGVTWLTRGRATRISLAILAILVIVFSWPWLRLAPHYSTYFNPLLGGGHRAVELFIVGGGEGLDLAADYLNEMPEAEDMRVQSFYPQVFRHYFVGHTQSLRYGSWSGLPLDAQYVVVTSAQAQRGIYPSTLEFFLPRQPEHTVNINGIDYAWVYRVPRQEAGAPPPIQHPVEANFEHRVHLVGYDAVQVDDELRLTLYWQLIVSMAEQLRIRLQMIDRAGHPIVEQDDPPGSGEATVLSWPGGLAIRTQHTLHLPEAHATGDYDVAVSVLERSEDGQDRLLALEGKEGSTVILGPLFMGSP
jgi:hypothetical protein